MKHIGVLLCGVLFALGAYAQSVQRCERVGIVLSGGGALGYAHIGVLQALSEYGIHPSVVAGASMGALVGSLYAQGLSAQQIFDVVKEAQFDRLFKVLSTAQKNNRLGLASHKNVQRVFDTYLPHDSFDSLRYPLYISVTNLTKGEMEIVHSGGCLHDYLLASSSIPGVFEPVVIDSMCYVDGGVLNNFPARAIRDKCDILIGVDVNPKDGAAKLNNGIDILMRTMGVSLWQNSVFDRALCDHVILSYANKTYNVMSFSDFEVIFQLGYAAAIKYLKEHPDLVQKAGGHAPQ